jgi:hypothetical protein
MEQKPVSPPFSSCDGARKGEMRLVAMATYLPESGLNDSAKATSGDTAGKPPLFFRVPGASTAKGSAVEANQAKTEELLEWKGRTQPQSDPPRISGNGHADRQVIGSKPILRAGPMRLAADFTRNSTNPAIEPSPFFTKQGERQSSKLSDSSSSI